jgi:UDP-glucose 4-epimerase
MVLPAFVRSALAGDPIRVFGDGAQTRNFTYVDDCIDALMRLLENPASNGKVFNIGGNEEVSMQTLAERVRTAAESSSLIEMVSYQEAYPEGSFEDMRRRVPCICHIRGLTGWAPTTSLNAIIRKTIEHERNRRESKPLPCPPPVVHQDLALEAR